MFAGMILMEAIHSCAIEHPTGCGCDICRASDGDKEALLRVWVKAQDELDARREGRSK